MAPARACPIGASVPQERGGLPSGRHKDERDRWLKKKGGRFGRLSNEEERRGVKHNRWVALNPPIGRCAQNFSFFSKMGRFACLRCGGACDMDRESNYLACPFTLEPG
jgi:hypothetical protein